MTDDLLPKPDQPESNQRDSDRPDLDGPAADVLEAEEASKAAASDTFEQAIDGLSESEPPAHREPEEPAVEPGPAPQLERLQKILAQAGIASRRHAEELITQGRVQVNGKIVTELGTKADAARDHIRVDGKLLQGSERLRYFMLNKPKGFVTTVSDPEGRPTIMQFFSKMHERLYPVGRLDYLSEGLLLVTNDGDLANKLTRAATGVEKTYLVKVSGQPSEEDIQRLREGVGIDRGKPGSGRVQTAPAEIRRFRPGRPGSNPRGGQRGTENPWYEVVLIEGRNRELRKMFEEIGHRVEKIRRVGYGPLVLDLEPGNLRELEPEEIENLRKASEGKYRKPKPREPRRQVAQSDPRQFGSKPHWKQRDDGVREERGSNSRPERPGGRRERGPSRRPQQGGFRSSPRGGFRSQSRGVESRPERGPESAPSRSERSSFRSSPRGEFRSKLRIEESHPERPTREASERPGGRPDRRPESGSSRDSARGQGQRPFRTQDRSKFRSQTRPDARSSQRSDERPSRPQKRERFENARPNDRGARPSRFGSRRPPRPDFGGRREDSSPRRDRQSDRDRQPRLEIRPGEVRGAPRRDENRPPRRDRENRPRFDRPRRESSGSPRSEGRSDRSDLRPDRRPDKRASAPRSGGNYRTAKRGGPVGKQGSVRSSSGRRPDSRPGGNRGNKRRP